MDSQRDPRAPASAASIACGGAGRDWLRLDSVAAGDEGRKALTRERLLSWAERLRGGDGPLGAHLLPEAVMRLAERPAEEAVPAEIPSAVDEPAGGRAIPASALVPVGRGARQDLAAAPPPAAAEPDVRLPRRGFRLRAVPSSPNVRFVLLCLAAFFFAAGVAHSFARWKPVRVIVVPETENTRSVIT